MDAQGLISEQMDFGSKNQYQNRLPKWMKSLIDSKSVDAWDEDPDAPSNSEISSSTKGILLNASKPTRSLNMPRMMIH